MLFAWLTFGLMVIVWLSAFVALTACTPLLLTARHERWLRRLGRSAWRVCETIWWLGPRPTVIRIRRTRPRDLPRPTRVTRRRAA